MDVTPAMGRTRGPWTGIPAMLGRVLDRLPYLLVGAAVVRVLAMLAGVPFQGGRDLELSTQAAHQQVPLICIAAGILGAWRIRGEGRDVRVLAAVIGALVTAGSLSGSVEATLTGTTSWAGIAFLVGAAVLVGAFTPIVNRGSPRSLLLATWLDTALFLVAGTITLGVGWGAFAVDGTVRDLLVVAALVIVAAWSGAGILLLLAREARVGRGGAYALMAGFGLASMGALGYLATLNAGGRSPFSWPVETVYLGGGLLITWGALTWTLDRDPRMRDSVAVTLLREALPTLAIMAALALYVVTRPTDRPASLGFEIARLAVVVGVGLAGTREMLLRVYEKRATAAEQAAEAEVAAHVHERRQISRMLAGLDAGDSVTTTADRICRRAAGLPGIDFAIVNVREGPGRFAATAAAGVGLEALPGTPLPAPLACHLEERMAQGAWREPTTPWLDPVLGAESRGEILGIALATESGPIGVLVLGSRSRMNPADAERRLMAIREAAVVAAAMLAPGVAADRCLRERRERVDAVIAGEAFFPVFQPIVDLATRAVKGFEALTRFADGTRPDLVFQEADEAGRGIELELATLGVAMRECGTLPQDAYVSVNLSAGLASRPELLGPILTRMPRDLLLEITEHVPVADYEILMASLYALDLRVRIAVDDAGSGYAGLAHILAVRPHVVKLDQSLVRSVDLDLARQALIGSMVAFTGRTGAIVVAEGVETEGEAEMLRGLGAQLGQGYLFGRPERAPARVAGEVTAEVAATAAN